LCGLESGEPRRKAALAVPDELFDCGETLSKKPGNCRSRLYATALAESLAKHRAPTAGPSSLTAPMTVPGPSEKVTVP